MRIFVLLPLMFWVATTPVRLTIDASRINPPNLSDISYRCTAIHLKISNFNPLGIEKVYIIKNNLYILQRYQESSIHYSHVFVCDTLGNLKRELIAVDPISKETMQIIDMQYDMINHRIYLLYSDGYRTFDSDGKLVQQKTKIKTESNFKYVFIYNEQFWSVENSFSKGEANYSLVHTDLNGLSKDTVISKNFNLPSFLVEKGIAIYASPSFSIYNKKLFVSLGIDNTIYSINQSSLVPEYKFEIKGSTSSSSIDMFGGQKQIILSRFIKYGYRLNGISYDFLYDMENKKSYNIKYILDHNECILGIKDDVFKTGFFKLNPTNDENYVFFFKKPDKTNNNLSSPTIFLVKLK